MGGHWRKTGRLPRDVGCFGHVCVGMCVCACVEDGSNNIAKGSFRMPSGSTFAALWTGHRALCLLFCIHLLVYAGLGSGLRSDDGNSADKFLNGRLYWHSERLLVINTPRTPNKLSWWHSQCGQLSRARNCPLEPAEKGKQGRHDRGFW